MQSKNTIKLQIITFDSTHKAIRTEKLLKDEIKGVLIPTPREVSASCGLSLKLAEGTVGRAYELISKTPSGFDGIIFYEIERSKDKKTATIMDLNDTQM